MWSGQHLTQYYERMRLLPHKRVDWASNSCDFSFCYIRTHNWECLCTVVNKQTKCMKPDIIVSRLDYTWSSFVRNAQKRVSDDCKVLQNDMWIQLPSGDVNGKQKFSSVRWRLVISEDTCWFCAVGWIWSLCWTICCSVIFAVVWLPSKSHVKCVWSVSTFHFIF